jgi:hypothetical protein
MIIKMTNTNAVKEQDSSFRFERLNTGYTMTFSEAIVNKESENDNDVTALMYKMDGLGNSYQRFGIYSFRRNVKFIEDTTTNRKHVKEANKLIEQLISTKGKSLTYADLKAVYNVLDKLEYINPFKQEKEGEIHVPDSIEIIGVHPKVNIGLFDAPSNKSKIRYTTRSYKANSYVQKDNGQFVTDENGESLSYMARTLANDEKYDDIIDLYDVAEVDAKAAKDVKNVVFNNAICVINA